MEDKRLKYQELLKYLDNLIETDKLRPGDKLPSENTLAEKFCISRQTVRHTIGIMEEDGKVVRIREAGLMSVILKP